MEGNKIKSKKMKAIICPRCKTNLVLSVDQNIEIDKCPACKGVWLDHGEFDKLIERSSNYGSNSRKTKDHDSHHEKYLDDEYESEHDNRYDYGRSGYRNQTRRRKGFLSELINF
jgi:Zn-finger nucleic acid-binding protein